MNIYSRHGPWFVLFWNRNTADILHYFYQIMKQHENKCNVYLSRRNIPFCSNLAKVTFTVWFVPSLTLSAARFSSLSSSSFPHSLGSKPIYISCSPCTSLRLFSALWHCVTRTKKNARRSSCSVQGSQRWTGQMVSHISVRMYINATLNFEYFKRLVTCFIAHRLVLFIHQYIRPPCMLSVVVCEWTFLED